MVFSYPISTKMYIQMGVQKLFDFLYGKNGMKYDAEPCSKEMLARQN